MSRREPTHYRFLSQLQEWQDNYNQGDVVAIAYSIRRFGFNNALRVWQENIIAAGNHTAKALRRIFSEGPIPDLDRQWPPANIIVRGKEWLVPCVDVAHLDSTEMKAFAIADNQLARRAVADERLLSQYLQEIAAVDEKMLLATGVDRDEMEEMVARVASALIEAPADVAPQADHADELRQKWKAESGQLWLIPSQTTQGNHRLLCGDSTSHGDVQRLMNGQRAVLFATDPPYLVGYNGTNHPQDWGDDQKNKDWSETYQDWDDPAQGEDFYDRFVQVAIDHAVEVDAAWYCWHASRWQAMLERVWVKYGAFMHQQIIWVKDRPVLTRSHYMWQHEPCLMGWVKGNKPRRTADDFPSTVWQVPTIAPGETTDHPTSKPVELFKIPMQQHTHPGQVCYEPFAGSGTQYVAGEQLGRLVYGLELQPQYVAVILERLNNIGLRPRLAD